MPDSTPSTNLGQILTPGFEPSLAVQVTVVTGAAGGFRSALAHALARRGVLVIACDVDDEGLERLSSVGDGSIHAKRVDLTDPADIEVTVERIATEHGDINILIHTAIRHVPDAVGKEARVFADHTPAQVPETLAVAITGPTLPTQLVSRQMVDRGNGRIAFTGSMHQTGTAGLVMYAAAKASINALAQGLFLELRDHDIITTIANPGGMNTDLHWHRHSWMLDPAVVAETILRQIALLGSIALPGFDKVPMIRGTRTGSDHQQIEGDRPLDSHGAGGRLTTLRSTSRPCPNARGDGIRAGACCLMWSCVPLSGREWQHDGPGSCSRQPPLPTIAAQRQRRSS